MQLQLFDFSDYRSFLRKALDKERQLQKGVQQRLADHLKCRSAYLSMVISSRAELSVEQAAGVAEFFRLSERETHYFILLIQRERAGTVSLRAYFQKQIDQAIAERSILERRIETNQELTEVQQAVMYSTWYYSAIHLALTIPTLRTREALHRYLRLPQATINEVLEFLVSTGLARTTRNGYEVGPTRIHLNATSPLRRQSHVHWRLQALQSLQQPSLEDFHYSSIVTMSRKDIARVKEELMRAIEGTRQVVRDSPEEDLFCYSLDLFALAPQSGCIA